MTDRPDGRNYFTTAEAVGTAPLEMFSLEKQRNNLKIEAGAVDLKDEVRSILTDVPNWLPLAAEVLGISRDINRYILTPVVSMPSDLPNRNQQAFPFEELTRWQPEYGMPMYKTFSGMPAHIDHINNDATKAKGIILSTLMRPIKNTAGDIYKLIKLVAWDRDRDSILCNDILTRKRTSYSMGAYAKDYICSVCATKLTSGGCEHLEHGRPSFRMYDTNNKQVTAGGKLAYYNVSDAKGFEISSVNSPAYFSAKDVNYFMVDDTKLS